MNIFNFQKCWQQPTLFQMSSLFKSVLRSQNHPQSLKLKLKAQSSIQCEHTEVFSLSLSLSLNIMLRLSGLSRFVGKSGVQMAEEGDIRLSSPKKQIHRAA